MRRHILTLVFLFLVGALLHPGALFAESRLSVDYAWGEKLPEASAWQNIPEGGKSSFPNPETGGPKPLWLRYNIARLSENDPVLFLDRVDEAFVAFREGKPIYSWGNLDRQGKPIFNGRPWHMIPLQNGVKNQSVVLRVLSSSSQIGVMGTPKIGDHVAIIADMWKGEIDKIILAWQAIFVGLIGIAFGLRRHIRSDYVAIGIFSLLLGIWIQSTAWTQTKQFLWDNPLGWFYLDVYSLLLIPIPIAFFMRDILGKQGQWLSIAIPIFSILSPLAIVVSAFNWLDIQTVLAAFQLSYFLLATGTIVSVLFASYQGNHEARIFSIGMIILLVLGAYDILLDLHLIHAEKQLSYWGGYAFIGCMLFILRQRFSNTYTRMNRYRKHLELILSSTREMAISQTEIDAVLVFCVDLANAEVIPSTTRLVAVPDNWTLPLDSRTALSGTTTFHLTISKDPAVEIRQQLPLISHDIASRGAVGEKSRFRSIQLIPREPTTDVRHQLETVRPQSSAPQTALRQSDNELIISLAYNERFVLHLLFEMAPDRILSRDELNFVRTLAESLSMVLLGHDMATHRRGEETRRLQQDRKHLVAQISLAAHLSDKLNSPLLVLDNALERIRRAANQNEFGGDSEGGSHLLSKLVEMLDDAVRKIKEVSKKLSDLREKGRNIESTKILDTAELEASAEGPSQT